MGSNTQPQLVAVGRTDGAVAVGIFGRRRRDVATSRSFLPVETSHRPTRRGALCHRVPCSRSTRAPGGKKAVSPQRVRRTRRPRPPHHTTRAKAKPPPRLTLSRRAVRWAGGVPCVWCCACVANSSSPSLDSTEKIPLSPALSRLAQTHTLATPPPSPAPTPPDPDLRAAAAAAAVAGV